MRKHNFILFALVIALSLLLSSCDFFAAESPSPSPDEPEPPSLSPTPTPTPTPSPTPIFVETGATVEERFNVPDGFTRVSVESGSYEEYLRKQPLKNAKSAVYNHKGETVSSAMHAAVFSKNVGQTDRCQTTDPLINLRSAYLFSKSSFDAITYHFMNGFEMGFGKWSDGYRVNIDPKTNKVDWKKTGTVDATAEQFEKYLTVLFAYSNATSLKQDVDDANSPQIGDIFLTNGGAMIIDMAIDNETAQKIVILARGGSPTHDVYIPKGGENNALSPWCAVENSQISTAEFSYSMADLKRFKN